jgi:hypothetical protein
VTDQPSVPAGTGDGAPALLGPSEPVPEEPEASGQMPRWVKVLAVIGVVLVVLIVVMLLSGHGPGRHMHNGLRGTSTSAGLAPGGVAALDGQPA